MSRAIVILAIFALLPTSGGSPLAPVEAQRPPPSSCTSDAPDVTVCTWEAAFLPSQYAGAGWMLPPGLALSVVKMEITTDSQAGYYWAFCEDPPRSETRCPVGLSQDPTPGSAAQRAPTTVVVPFRPHWTYHLMLFADDTGGIVAITPQQYHVRGEFHQVTRNVPAGGHAGTFEDPQLHDAASTDSGTPSGDITGGWIDQPFLDDGLIEVGLVVPHIEEVRARVGDEIAFLFSFDILGETWEVEWATHAGNSYGNENGWEATLSRAGGSGAHVILPFQMDATNHTLTTMLPLAGLGSPAPGDAFTNLSALSYHVLAAKRGRGSTAARDPGSTIDDVADSVDRPFTTGGPAYWDRIRPGYQPPADPPGPAWTAQPLAQPNLPFTLLLVGLVALGGAGGAALFAARRRTAGLAGVHSSFADVAPGALVAGKYRVERELGQGGGGRVFLAQDVRMKRKVVLKALTSRDQAAAIREARAGAAIDHPNVVRIYDVDDLGSSALLVMEHVNGGSLKERLSMGGALSDEAFARLADDLLAALAAVHAGGAVHRDIKPSNILLTRDGQAKLADFGIARLPGFEATIGNATTGTVQYMSPEQARGKRVTPLSDLYSAAATLYEARTGEPLVAPIAEESPVEMQMRVGAGRAFDASIEPPALRAWFAKALAPAPGERYQNADEMRSALADVL